MGKQRLKHAFECAPGLDESSVIVPVDSDELGAVTSTTTLGPKSRGWAFFKGVPYKAGVGGVFKAVRETSGLVEHVFLVAWHGFGAEWDAYLWHDQIFPQTEDNEAIFKAQQKLAFEKDRQGSGGTGGSANKKRKSLDKSKPKPKKTVSDLEAVRAALRAEGPAGFDDEDDDDDDGGYSRGRAARGDDDDDDDATTPDDDGDDDAAATAAAVKRKKKAVSAPVAVGGGGSAATRAARAVEDALRRPIADLQVELPLEAQWAMQTPWVDNEPRLHGALEDSVITLAFPQELIDQLLKNQQWVKEQNFPLPLPRSPTVVDVLNDFVRDGNEADYLNRLYAAQAFVSVFDACFPLLLLYKNERPQFDKLKTSERSGPSTVYGAEHLLRFISRAPEVLGVVRMLPEVTRVYERMLNQLILFLKAKRRDYFLS